MIQNVWDGASHLQRLREEKARLLVMQGEEVVFRSEGRGIRPLLKVSDSVAPESLHGATFVDRVVGRAAALLMVHASAGAVAAIVVSDNAMDICRRFGVPVYREERATHITGRDPGKPCPFEQAVADVDEPRAAHSVLRKLADEMGLLA